MALKFSIRFYPLKAKPRNKETSLRAFVRYNSLNVPFLTDVKVEPRYFNVAKQLADVSSRFDGSRVNDRLLEIAGFVKSRFGDMVEYPNPDSFERMCENFVRSGQINADFQDGIHPKLPKHLFEAIEKLVKDSESGARLINKGPRKGQKYKPDTIKPYKSTLYVLKKFAANENIDDIPLKLVNENFYKRLSKFFYDDLMLSVGYFSTIIKVIKLAMNEYGMGFSGHDDRGFIKPDYEADTISLDLDQLRILQNHEFGQEQRALEHVRDLFLVGCWTGLRYEDFTSIRKQDIHKDFIRIRTDKTEGRVSIPYHPMLRSIFDKYGGGPPPSIHINSLNSNIKKACRLAGLKEEIQVRKNVGGKDVLVTKSIYELVSTHTARRSFASNMFRLGIPSLLIMAITGHKTEKSFLKYIRVGDEEKSRMMAELWKKIDWD